MFARPVLRATAAARVGLRPALQVRTMSAPAAAPKASKMKQLMANTPVDLYPLFFFVTTAVAGSFFIMGWTLWTDPHLRLKPTSMQGGD
ncbi:uncharacterized protein CcaverHIS019_0503950 [Cutaneotrichosporon cavernicola]|uniref:Uncharacterized protein n=1 Tax=Cutaneotrichosporon cavernicola TaxID=279322 RepID=A0AA48L6D8_9TREE|nr:uncharacterized protein CcaverHIS019_0503950 [Cutaneotrichosporon cavernicola]BEI92767.1 hypothetical protein CcaverHIS019_0503950 [Cutaneotrichosporon cavernicola]